MPKRKYPKLDPVRDRQAAAMADALSDWLDLHFPKSKPWSRAETVRWAIWRTYESLRDDIPD